LQSVASIVLAFRLDPVLDHLETGRRKGVFLFCAAAFSSTIAVALASVAHQIGQP